MVSKSQSGYSITKFTTPKPATVPYDRLAKLNSVGTMDDLESGFRQFLTQIVSTRSRTSDFWILSGSVTEMPVYYVGCNPTDLDLLNFSLDTCATEKSRPKSVRHVKYLLLDTDDTPLGFARLRFIPKVGEKDFAKYSILRHALEPTYDDDHITVTFHGCAYKRTIAYEVTKVGSRVSRLLADFGLTQSDSDIGLLKMDIVSCIYCRDWPTVAGEFKKRVRSHGWPSKETIMQIVRSGCHLVPKSHHTDPEDKTCWRISFSMAETMLINSWTDTQKYIYHVLRIIKRRVVEECGGEDETPVCTYFFKTAMFWACEEKSLEFWKDQNVFSSLSEILLTVITDYLIEKLCPNYFIPHNNMAEHLKEVDFTKESRLLLEYHEQVKTFLENIPKSFPPVHHEISIPNKIIVFWFQIFTRFQMNMFPQRLARSPILDFLRATGSTSAFKALYNGINKHYDLAMLQHAHGSNATSDRWQMVKMALSCFEFAMSFENSDSSVVKVTTNETVSQFLGRLTQNALEGYLFSAAATRSLDKCSLITELEKVLRFFASSLPQATYFVSVAYFANFYYTYLRDFAFAHRLCYEAHISRSRSGLHVGTIDHFGMLLSNKWSPIFDDGVRSVIGFIVLWKDIAESIDDNKDSKPRSISRKDLHACVDINPIAFIRYIGALCGKAGGFLNTLKEDFFANPFNFRRSECNREELSNVILRAAMLANEDFMLS